MPSQYELDECYMQVALSHAKLSKAVRKKVGACLVTSTGIIIPGYNGMSSGGSNECEVSKWKQSTSDQVSTGKYELESKPEVIHSELNCILKAAKQGVSCLNSKIYVTLSPCLPCSEMLIQAGVIEVIYLEEYRCTRGVDNLNRRGVVIRQFNFGE